MTERRHPPDDGPCVRHLPTGDLYEVVAQSRSIDGLPVVLRDGGAPSFEVPGSLFAREYLPTCQSCGADGHYTHSCVGLPVCRACHRVKIKHPGVRGFVCTVCDRTTPVVSDALPSPVALRARREMRDATDIASYRATVRAALEAWDLDKPLSVDVHANPHATERIRADLVSAGYEVRVQTHGRPGGVDTLVITVAS